MTNTQIILIGVWACAAVMWASPRVKGGAAVIMTIIAGVVSLCVT